MFLGMKLDRWLCRSSSQEVISLSVETDLQPSVLGVPGWTSKLRSLQVEATEDWGGTSSSGTCALGLLGLLPAPNWESWEPSGCGDRSLETSEGLREVLQPSCVASLLLRRGLAKVVIPVPMEGRRGGRGGRMQKGGWEGKKEKKREEMKGQSRKQRVRLEP